MNAIPAGITLLIPSCVRYTAGYFKNSSRNHGITPNATPPITKYATNPPTAASKIRERFIRIPFRGTGVLGLLPFSLRPLRASSVNSASISFSALHHPSPESRPCHDTIPVTRAALHSLFSLGGRGFSPGVHVLDLELF